jgi:hypothetical protein
MGRRELCQDIAAMRNARGGFRGERDQIARLAEIATDVLETTEPRGAATG